MSDINYWYDEYSKEMDQLSLFVEKLKGLISSSNVKAIDSCIKECEGKMSRVREIKKSFNLELRLVRDREIRNEFDSKAKLQEDKYNEINKFVTQTKSNNGKKDLIGGDSGSRNMYSTEGKDNDALLGEANKIQDMTFSSLGRTRNMIEASKEIGSATIEQLRGQREQIVDIETEIDKLDSNLVRAEKLVFSFTKRMASDKIIRGFFCINIFVMLSLILYVAISGKSLSASSGGGSGAGPSKTNLPTLLPTATPTISLAPTFTPIPSVDPTLTPTVVPTLTFLPSVGPSVQPTQAPTFTPIPSVEPTPIPSMIPTLTFLPSVGPSLQPTQAPTFESTFTPTMIPSNVPTLDPTVASTTIPTLNPTVASTTIPTLNPTVASTTIPTVSPVASTDIPTVAPVTTTPSQAPVV